MRPAARLPSSVPWATPGVNSTRFHPFKRVETLPLKMALGIPRAKEETMRSTLNSLPAFPFLSFPLLVGLLLHAPRAGAQEPSDWRADVDRFASRVVELGIAPGIGLAVSQGDRVVHAAGFGMADLDTGRAVDENTAHASMSGTVIIYGRATNVCQNTQMNEPLPVTQAWDPRAGVTYENVA